ncbi:MAG TPA: thioesterase family protein [Bdellovibrionota bacterium]|nr:thioesterase family protein [Bdellovibrionota bacterium]
MPRIFEKPITVSKEHIDELGHVNNLVYLGWFVGAAIEHSTARGWPPEAYLKLGAGWVVRKHEIEYFAPAFPKDELLVRTWVESISGGSSVRRYELLRKSDQKKLAGASTVWVWIDFKTGRPGRIPPEVLSGFEVVGPT